MSSSVFAESPVSTNESRMCGDSNSNLVVVYGKNGINVDREGLETLIDEKNVSSISVVRLTSPTPSMKDEKDDEEETDENLQDGIDVSNLKISTKTDSPEIVGLTIEEFYPADEAKKVAREVMNYAGVVNPVHVKVDYEFQRFVIQNDHCYTPLTSPSQVKQKTAPVPSTNQEVAKPAMIKQYTNSKLKKSVELIEIDEKSGNETEKEEEGSDYTESSLSDSDNDRDSDLDFNVNDRQGKRRKAGIRKTRKSVSRTSKKRHSVTESTSGMEEEKKSGSSRIYNRLSFDQRKTIPTTSTIAQKTPTKSLSVVKSQPNIQIQQIQTIQPGPKVVVQQQPQLQLQPQQNQVQQPQVKIIQSGSNLADSEKAEVQLQMLTQAVRPRNVFVPNSQPEPIRPMTVQKFVLIKKDHKKSEGGFTDISTFLTQGDNNKSNVKVTELKPERSIPVQSQPSSQSQPQHQSQQQSQHQSQQQPQHQSQQQPQHQSQVQNQSQSQPQAVILHSTPTKGFMPLESAAKGQLPAQISIQTHTSSTELAAEHDKQLDLIDSIVKDEMEKSNIIVKNSMNENIPQLVKMLESTEKAVLGKTKSTSPVEMPRLAPPSSTSSTYTTTGVEDIDITNAPLLENAEDDLTEDLLQHVAELMDNKNLQEVVEKQVLAPEPLSQETSPVVDSLHRGTLAPSDPSTVISSSLSVISTITQDSTPHKSIASSTTQLQTPLSVKKEPIQIVRGDGRVITLPPIEAPTTRAKRRAQTQVVTPLAASMSTQATAGKNEGAGSRRNSNEQKATTAARKRSSVSSQSAPREDYTTTENESEEEDDSEDDPDKLWCICRQPHNNRFMICCDVCEDWFHGTCVNITKAMGLEMEANGIEWTCPKCMKKQEPNQRKAIQRKITEIFDKKQQQQQQQLQQQQQQQQQISEEPKKIQIESRRTTPSLSTIKKVDNKKSAESPTTSKVENKREAQKKITETGVARKLPDIFKREAQKKQTAEIHHRKSTENVQQKTAQSQSVQQSQESGQQEVGKNSDMPEIKTIEIVRSSQDDRRKSSEGQSGKLIIVPPGHSKVREEMMTTCIVCKKMSRPNSIYCSDDCIRQHAQNALISKNKASKASSTTVPPDDKKKKAFSSFEEALAKASETTFQVKNKVERVCVFERKTGRILTGSNAPTTANLKKWLQDNPTFEVVQPGSPQALTIERSKQQKTKGSNSGVVTSSAPSSSSSSESSPSIQYTAVKKGHSHMKLVEAHKITSSKLHKYPQQVSLKQGSSPQTTYLLSPTESKDSKEFKDAKEAKESKRDHASKETPTKPSIKKQTSVEQPKTPQPTTPTSEVEPVRLHMKRTLKEQLISRMNEVKNPNAPKLSLEEIEQFANETETEMFKLFNKDIGAKYKVKYRSLMFNIKDRKNETLFQKICEKKIEPKQLVRMSPEELASQELAQWRQNENKHQLEMIKKSELDLLSCAKNYVLKTHKGEEVIESKSTDRVSLDISIPVEDVVAVLNNSTVSSTSDELPPTPSSTSTSKEVYKLSNSLDTSDFDSSAISSDSKVGSTVSLQSPPTPVDSKKAEHLLLAFNKEREKSKEKDRAKDREKEKDIEKEKEREREREKDKEKHKERDRDRERHHAHKSNQKDKMKSKKRSRSRSRSREKEHRHKSPHKEDKRDSVTTSSKDKDKDNKIKEKDREPPSKKEKILIEVKMKPQIVSKPIIAKPKDPRRSSKTDCTELAKVEDYNLIDKILESTKTVEEAANLVNEKEKEKAAVKQAVSNTKPSSSTSTQKSATSSRPPSTPKVAETTSAGDSDQEPTSTVTIGTPPEDQYQRYSSDLSSIIWSGSINMIDVATFQIIIQPVCGVSTDLERDLPSELDIVGRISPDTVWDYIAKIKKSPNKEVVIIRLVPSSSSENIAYSALYMYLDKRKRLGVVKTTSSNIKDFYILPLTSKKLLPTVLQPVNNVEFFEDDSRPDLLMGIVIRIMGKRPAASAPPHSSSKVMRKTVEQSVISSSVPATGSEERFTPPDSPKNCPLKKLEKSIISAGRLPPKVNSPIDIDAVIAPVASKRKAQIATDDADEPYSPGGSSDDDIMSTVPPVVNPSSTPLDPIADELKRINRQIEAQQMEIVGILSGDQEIAAKSPYTTSAVAATATLGPALANISIPSNLQQILASIQSKPEATTSAVPPPPVIGSLLATNNSVNDDEEYTPQPAASYKPATAISEMVNSVANPPLALGVIPPNAPPRSTSVTSAVEFGKKQDVDMRIGLLEDPNQKKTRWDNQQPPPPGLEDEFI